MSQRLFVALASLGIVLAACTSTGSAPASAVPSSAPASVAPASAPASASATAYSMTYIAGIANEEFYITMACGAQEAADTAGVALDIQAGEKWDPAVQTPIVNGVIAKQPNAIIIAPNDRVAMIPPLKAAADAGIKLVIVDTGLDDYSFTVSHIASNNVQGATAAAETLAGLIGEKGKVVIVGGTPGVTTSDERSKGFNDGMAKYPDITVLDQQYAVTGGAEEAASQMSAVIAANPDIAGVFALALVPAEGIATSLQQNDMAGKVKVVSFDAGPAQVEALRKGVIDALVAQKPGEMGRLGVEQALKALNGEATEKELSPGFVPITKENVDAPDIQPWLYKKTCS